MKKQLLSHLGKGWEMEIPSRREGVCCACDRTRISSSKLHVILSFFFDHFGRVKSYHLRYATIIAKIFEFETSPFTTFFKNFSEAPKHPEIEEKVAI